MKNVFITRRKHNLDIPIEKKYIVDDLGRSWPVEDVAADSEIEITDSLDLFHDVMKSNEKVAIDTEGNSLNQFYHDLLLVQIGIPGLSFIIDNGSIHEDYLSPYLEDHLFLGHNLQHDYRMLKYCKGWELAQMRDIMVREQIINRGSGRFNNMEDTYLRRCNKKLPEDKKTRNDFIKMNPRSLFERRHIVYAGFDPQTAFEIEVVQDPILDQLGLRFRADVIGMKLIRDLGDANLKGRNLDKDAWRKVLEENKIEKFKIERELDAIIKEDFAPDHVKLRGGIWSSSSRKRKKEDGRQLGMFGRDILISTESLGNVPYNSVHKLKKLFEILDEPLPMKEDKKAERTWGEDAPMKVSFDEPTLEQYKIEYPSSKMIKFINKLLEFKTVTKEIDSFGEVFLQEFMKDGKSGKKFKRGYYQPKTDRIHTIYKGEFTDNGRLSSGGEKKAKGDMGVGFDNSQNWPKKNKFRHCICLTQAEIDEGYWISTRDLTAAELVILASKSQDPALMEHCRGDLHSYLATFSYTNVVKYILDTMNENRAYTELYDLLKVNRLQEAYKVVHDISIVDGEEVKLYRLPNKEEIEFITKQRVENVFNTRELKVDKKIFPDLREPYKNVTYGVNYGAEKGKIAKTLNIAPYYAELVMGGITKAIPQAMAFMATKARDAVRDGFVIFNDRTNSRHWFKAAIEAHTYGRPLSSKEKGDIERETKNYLMSGTQADMFKEATIEVSDFVRSIKLDFHWLMFIHDEWVFMHKDKDIVSEIDKIIVTTCNKYLRNIEMKVDGHTGYTWHKG